VEGHAPELAAQVDRVQLAADQPDGSCVAQLMHDHADNVGGHEHRDEGDISRGGLVPRRLQPEQPLSAPENDHEGQQWQRWLQEGQRSPHTQSMTEQVIGG
jgi:hypothetical protein